MTDTCICCGGYVPEGRQVCKECEESTVTPSDSTANGLMRKYYTEILKSVQNRTGKQLDTQIILDISNIGLVTKISQLINSTTINSGKRYQVIQAVAEMRVIIEQLILLHCRSKEGADAYRFYLEQALKDLSSQTARRQ